MKFKVTFWSNISERTTVHTDGMEFLITLDGRVCENCGTKEKPVWDEILDADYELEIIEDDNKWIEINVPFGPLFEKKTTKRLESFNLRALNKSGTLMLLEDGREILIGTINEQNGICDDCRGISEESIVKAYKVIWRNPNEQIGGQK